MAVDVAKIRFFADFIEQRSGIVYGESNHFQLVRRLEEITTTLGLKGIEELYHQAKTGVDGTLKDMLLDVATNNETSFFRDPSMFRALETTLIPTLQKEYPMRDPLRLWSAASSTGQEAYSVAMTFEGMRARGVPTPAYRIYATDISERVLRKASEAVYSQLEVQRGLSAKLLIQHFEKRPENAWAVKPDLKKHVRFGRLNLLGDWSAMPTFDIILCRNVLIYQSIENKGRVIKKLHEHLAPGGYLVLGATETMLGLPERALFKDERAENVFFFRKA